jgi:hypothetical protein
MSKKLYLNLIKEKEENKEMKETITAGENKATLHRPSQKVCMVTICCRNLLFVENKRA